MAKTLSLTELLKDATDEDRAALRAALAAPAPAGPPREVLSTDALRSLQARAESARRRLTVDRGKIAAELASVTAARDKAQAEMTRLGAAIDSLDFLAGSELDNVRREAFAGRPLFVAEAAAELRREAAELRPDVVAGGPRDPFPGSPAELFSNAASCDVRRGALLALAERLEARASEAAFIVPDDLAEWLDAERAKLPALEDPQAVRRRVAAARAAA